MKFEYCISAGPGTLIAYGVCDGVIDANGGLAIKAYGNLFFQWVGDGETLIIAPCSDDCTTGT